MGMCMNGLRMAMAPTRPSESKGLGDWRWASGPVAGTSATKLKALVLGLELERGGPLAAVAELASVLPVPCSMTRGLAQDSKMGQLSTRPRQSSQVVKLRPVVLKSLLPRGVLKPDPCIHPLWCSMRCAWGGKEGADMSSSCLSKKAPGSRFGSV